LFIQFFGFFSLTLDFLRLQLKIPSQVVQFIEKPAAACVRQPESSFGIQAQLSRICHASSPSPSGRKLVDTLLPAFSPPEVTGRCQMTNRFGIYLCRGSCRSDEELVGRAIDLPWRSLPAVSCLCYWAGQDLGILRMISRQHSRLRRLESRRFGFEPLCQRKQSSFDTSALADRPAATLSRFDS